MHKTHAKRRRDIKNKLMAAICMLLVSSIMMVSTTYAWFTLSTAPEVTGINTAVGANGNLEMALMPASGQLSEISSAAGDGVLDWSVRNMTWGNLVDVSDNNLYGLDKINLYPSALNLTDDGKVAVGGSILKTPKYGADGRVTELAPNTLTGTYQNQEGGTKAFMPDELKGVRAVGSASGMTPRQLSYRNARQAANTAKAQAANLAATSLNTNGSSLANIAIKYGMDSNNATFGKADVESLRAIIDDLNGPGGVLDQLETAYMQYILAYAASAANTLGDTAWQAVEGEVTKEGATLTSVTTALTTAGMTIPTEVQTGIDEYNGAVTAVTTADSKLAAMEETLKTNADATFTWAQLREAMEPLANPAAMKINGFLASQVKEKLGDLVSSVTEQGGLKVILETGAGVYADIADQSGDYTASVTIESVTYEGITLNNMKARMETKTSVNPQYLAAVGTAVELAGAPASASGTALPISDTYGYIIDLAFRTNASESKLLLQQEAKDRIYGDNSNEETMGHGASMTFMATTTDFSNDQVKGLMDAITIIFFNPTDGTIYCYGGLDTANATVGADGVTAKIYLYKLTGNTTTYVAANYETGKGDNYYYTKTTTTEDVYTAVTADATYDSSEHYFTKGTSGTDYVEDTGVTADNFGDKVTAGLYTKTTNTKDVYTAVTDADASQAPANTLYVATTSAAGKETITSNEIMPLTQNTPHALSVLVYLDGNNVGNDDVAATAASSMTGTMNLQFASSANLVPMEYADLHIPGAATESTGAGTTESTGTGTDASTPSETQSQNP